MTKSKKHIYRTLLLLIAIVVIVIVVGFGLLGGKACISHIFAVRPNVEIRYRFGDLNAKHLIYAKRIGIKPLKDRGDIADVEDRLSKVNSCQYYFIKSGKHSLPYLVPEAARLLKDIGQDFQQRLVNSGYHPHSIVITSLLRTKFDVKNLKEVNNVAISNSAHLNGTTFDISYARFVPWLGTGKVPDRDVLACTLGETLDELRNHGRCCVKFENSTNCYHVTVCK